MDVPDVDDRNQLGESMLEEIKRTAERRLRQLEPLLEEAEQLRGVLDAIANSPPSGEQRARPARSAKSITPRAKKGANKSVILDLASRRPGITPAEIAKLTGMKRTVAASTVSRLKRYGYLQEHERGGVRLGRAARGEHQSPAVTSAS